MHNRNVGFKRPKLDSTSSSNENESNSIEMTKKYGIGAKLLAQMGYVSGQGLGSDGKGIFNPIEAVKRPQGKVGLGMLSSTADRINRQDDDFYSSEDENMNSSSDEDISTLKTNAIKSLIKKDNSKFVAFNKKGTVTLNNSERLKLLNKLRGLEINDPNINIPSVLKEDLENKPEISKDMRLELLDIVQKLEHIELRLKSLDLRIPSLKTEQQQIESTNSILLQLDENISKLELLPNGEFLQTYIDKIMQLQDDDVLDSLMAKLIRITFLQEPFNSDDNWMLKDNMFEKCIFPIIDTLQYRINDELFSDRKLNKTQTVIFRIVHPKIEKLVKGINFEDGVNYKRIITVLVDYEPTLKYIHCYDNIFGALIMPMLLAELSKTVANNVSDSNITWLLDFISLLPSENIKEIQSSLQHIFKSYCTNWYYRDPVISRENITVIKTILEDDQYYQIVQREFTPTVEEFVSKYYKLEVELDDNQREKMDSGFFTSMDVFRFIRSIKYIIYPKDYDAFIYLFFNGINKILYDWVFYYGDDNKMRHKAEKWFSWFINGVFSGYTDKNKPDSNEVAQIKITKQFLENIDNNSNPIHDEFFSIVEVLISNLLGNDENEDSTNKKKSDENYTIDTIPMRKVAVTFKEVVEDYCFANGCILEKLSNKYTDISIGSRHSVLVPIFQVKNGSKNRNIALKDDILWVEGKDGNYVPTYLRDFKL